ncbi:MAG: UMP kinase [Candidatus Hydrogenedentota bacterium]|nr:MAG: UMP kinase [Candidatus Hydrogenedentota bacterium]
MTKKKNTKRKSTGREKLKYRRILLKLSGEALQGDRRYNIDPTIVDALADEIAQAHRLGIQIAVVIGGGNIFRGASAAALGIDRVTGDMMGMLATVINALALQNGLEHKGVPTRVLTAIEMRQIAELFIKRRAVRHLEKGRIVIFAAGTGNPYFSTDTAAALRANEISADIILKGTKVDGIYDSDPIENADATRFESISFQEVLLRDLKAMDSTATSLCRENSLPILVFDITKSGNIVRILKGETVGTLVR